MYLVRNHYLPSNWFGEAIHVPFKNTYYNRCETSIGFLDGPEVSQNERIRLVFFTSPPVD